MCLCRGVAPGPLVAEGRPKLGRKPSAAALQRPWLACGMRFEGDTAVIAINEPFIMSPRDGTRKRSRFEGAALQFDQPDPGLWSAAHLSCIPVSLYYFCICFVSLEAGLVGSAVDVASVGLGSVPAPVPVVTAPASAPSPSDPMNTSFPSLPYLPFPPPGPSVRPQGTHARWLHPPHFTLST